MNTPGGTPLTPPPTRAEVERVIAEASKKPICSMPEDCCRELSRVWAALGKTVARWSCFEHVLAMKERVDWLSADLEAAHTQNAKLAARAVVAEHAQTLSLLGRSSEQEAREDRLRTKLAEAQVALEAAQQENAELTERLSILEALRALSAKLKAAQQNSEALKAKLELILDATKAAELSETAKLSAINSIAQSHHAFTAEDVAWARKHLPDYFKTHSLPAPPETQP